MESAQQLNFFSANASWITPVGILLLLIMGLVAFLFFDHRSALQIQTLQDIESHFSGLGLGVMPIEPEAYEQVAEEEVYGEAMGEFFANTPQAAAESGMVDRAQVMPGNIDYLQVAAEEARHAYGSIYDTGKSGRRYSREELETIIKR